MFTKKNCLIHLFFIVIAAGLYRYGIKAPDLTWNMFLYGLWAGVDNLAEQFTSRINYFLLQRFSGVGSVGLFDAGTKVSESVWNISRSISFIVFGKVAQTEDANIQKNTR